MLTEINPRESLNIQRANNTPHMGQSFIERNITAFDMNTYRLSQARARTCSLLNNHQKIRSSLNIKPLHHKQAL